MKFVPFKPNETVELNRRLNAENSRVCLAGLYGPMARIGVRSFLVFMEYRHFPPHIPEMNQRYEFALISMLDFVFATILFPRRYLPQADELLKSLGLVRAGVPVAAQVPGTKLFVQASTRRTGAAFEELKRQTGHNWEVFPLTGPNVFGLENIDRHFTYANNRAEYEKAMAAEDTAIRREIDTYEITFATQIAKVRKAAGI